MNSRVDLQEVLGGLLLIGMFYMTIWMLYLTAPEN